MTFDTLMWRTELNERVRFNIAINSVHSTIHHRRNNPLRIKRIGVRIAIDIDGQPVSQGPQGGVFKSVRSKATGVDQAIGQHQGRQEWQTQARISRCHIRLHGAADDDRDDAAAGRLPAPGRQGHGGLG